MSEYLPFVIVGLVTGAVYALASMGLVLTYTTSGVFNFAHGAVGMFATYLFHSLRVEVGLPTVLALVVAVLVAAPAIGVVIDRVLLRGLAGAPPQVHVVASLGLLVALQGLAVAIYGPSSRQVAALFPRDTFRLPGVNVGVDQALVVAVAVVAAIGLGVVFRRTHVGLRTRAVVGDPELAELVGTNTALVTTGSWMLGCAFSALSGILFAPFIGLDSVLLTLLVVQAFGAAIVGRLRSLSLTNLGAYGIGIAAALCTKLATGRPHLAGLPSALPFIVLFAVLVLSPRGRLVEATTVARDRFRAARPRLPVAGLAAIGVTAAALPAVLDTSKLLVATSTAAFALVFASLSLLVGLSRQVSLCHAVFVVLGATTVAHLLEAGVPFGPALALAAAAVVPAGALLAIPAIRLSGLFLALATFGFGILVQNLVFPLEFVFGGESIVSVPRPEAFQGDVAFYYLVVSVVLSGVAAVEVIRVTRLGRILRALADSPTAMESMGINPVASRVLVFCGSAFLAAVAGGLLGALTQSVNPASFDFFHSLVWVTVLVTSGTQTLGGVILASGFLVAGPAVLEAPAVTEWQPVGFGVAAMILAQTPGGLAGILFRRPHFAALARRSAERLEHRRAAERYVATWARRAEAG